MSRRIAVYTGSRADLSPLTPVIKILGDICILIQTEGMYGLECEIREKLKVAGADFLVILGDRFESAIAALVAVEMVLPIVHLHGGEETVGATDNSYRHCISKLSYYHFAIHEDYAKRIIQMGEHPDRVFVTGAPGVDQYAEPGINILNPPRALVCYHPETLGNDEANLIKLSEELGNVGSYVVSTTNEDIGNQTVKDFWKLHGVEPQSFSQGKWISLMKQTDVLIGNSSCFILEGFTLGKEVIMIGDRQKGRYEEALRHFADNPYAYGKPGEVTPKIAELLLTLPIPEKPRKKFYDIAH